jgi:hypothetical protein
MQQRVVIFELAPRLEAAAMPVRQPLELVG